ncbi:MAG: HupE/UreJ family protein [Gammaproteobacteria bacterium]
MARDSRLLPRLFAACVMACATPLSAHEYLPAYLQLRETAAETYEVLFKLPAAGAVRLPIYARLPERCMPTSPTRVTSDKTAHVETWSARCAGGLGGASALVEGLELMPTDALVRVEWQDGASQVARLTPDEPSVLLEGAPGGGQVAATYLKLGVEHILLGIDHLLFVLALLIVTRGAWRMVATVTAFTIAHSITLGLATLGFVHVPSAPVEAVIALSIVFVAAEIVRMRRGRIGITARAPWIVAFVFGLLHGFGFAGALSEVGLPESHIPLALLFFNLGVEAGQLIFVAAMLMCVALFRRASLALPAWAELVPAYAIGSIAMMWVVERIGAF